ncbi:hypothetical protein GWC77_20200 [Paraburkholderia sp. NMBU_R16]|uniref:hypothetical protein n=1 Tax=Paraburkholderia sp. NMBU_R16 TaxID=2698676 RepID=UPI001565E840|nr:hypothetical protein [Paraburkholderia sp. NMBU_R16]NRO98249.1 hypothetical protein [Paraburkholderia sp. NMBU_R16]
MKRVVPLLMVSSAVLSGTSSFALKPDGGTGSLAFETMSDSGKKHVFGVEVTRVSFTIDTGANAAWQPSIGHVIVSPPDIDGIRFGCMLPKNAIEQPASIAP